MSLCPECGSPWSGTLSCPECERRAHTQSTTNQSTNSQTKCKFCGYEISPMATECERCGGGTPYGLSREEEQRPTAPVSNISSVNQTANPVIKRYRDLYRAARLLISIGSTVKVVGIILAILIFLFWLIGGIVFASVEMRGVPLSQRGQPDPESFLVFGGLVVGAISGAFVGGLIFLLGILISAQGQLLLTQADAAVHTSPFLREEEKAKAMSLPY